MNAKVLEKIRNAPVPTAEQILASRIAIANCTWRAGGDRRGSSKDRARRVQKLLKEFGDGTTCPCSYCDRELTAVTLTQDKIYTGDEGGGYRYANLIPSCITCNQRRNDARIHEFIAEAQAAIENARTHLNTS